MKKVEKQEEMETKEVALTETQVQELETVCDEIHLEIVEKEKGLSVFQKVKAKLTSKETREKVAKVAEITKKSMLMLKMFKAYAKDEYKNAPTNTMKAIAGALCTVCRIKNPKKFLGLVGFEVEECRTVWQECGHLIAEDLLQFEAWDAERRKKLHASEAT